MSSDLASQLRELKALADEGLLTPEEFASEKAALLAARRGTTPPSPTNSPLAGAITANAAAQPTPTPSASPLHGATTVELPTRLGNYQVLGLVGVGGMGTVVRASHVEEGWARQQGGDVAIKLIHPQIAADTAFRERFFSEASLGKRVHHPSLATVYDVVSEGPWLYRTRNTVRPCDHHR